MKGRKVRAGGREERKHKDRMAKYKYIRVYKEEQRKGDRQAYRE